MSEPTEDKNSIKAFANKHGYSDVEPYQVIRTISDQTVEIRRMKYEKDPEWNPEFVSGGFAGHCINQGSQTWIITPDEGGQVLRIRSSKNSRYWKDKHGNKYIFSDEPRRFYDYNF
jgi:hypothetical protein